MKGIELNFKNEKISASIPSGSLHVIIGQKIDDSGKSNFRLDFSALNRIENEFIDWHKSELSVGDKIVIEIKDIKTNSEPITIRKANIPKPNINSKLESFYKLKKELEDQGLIKKSP